MLDRKDEKATAVQKIIRVLESSDDPESREAIVNDKSRERWQRHKADMVIYLLVAGIASLGILFPKLLMDEYYSYWVGLVLGIVSGVTICVLFSYGGLLREHSTIISTIHWTIMLLTIVVAVNPYLEHTPPGSWRVSAFIRTTFLAVALVFSVFMVAFIWRRRHKASSW